MPNEGTPLVESSGSSSQTRFERARDALKSKSRALVKAARDTNLPLRLLAILGGISLVFSGIGDLINDLLTLNFSDAIFEFHLLALGFIIIILESDKRFVCSQMIGEFIENYISILAFVSGRGVFYIIIGTLKLSQPSLVNVLEGLFLCFIGFLYYVTGISTAKKLGEISGGVVTSIKLRLKFDVADFEGNGDLDYDQFCRFLKSIGLDLSESESKLAFHQLDKNKNKRIDFEEICKFWDGYKFETERVSKEEEP